eukprot:gene13734-9718_t
MLALLLALLSGAAHSNAVDGGEEWDWSRTHTWMLVNIRGSRMSPYQAQFSATNYDIVGVGGIFDGKPNSGEVTQAAAAMQLKQINPNVTVLIYRNSGIVIEGELDSDLEFAAHPEWILQDATGSPIYNNPPSTTAPLINFTNPAAREWWVSSTVAAITGQPNGTAIDGVFIDGAGPMDEVLSPRLAPGQNTLLNASHTLAVRELTERLHALRPGMITLGNGAVVSSCGRSDDGSKWGKMDWAPCARNLPWLDGVCAEHFGSFESVNTTTGGYDTDGGIAQNHKGGNVNEKWQTALDIVREFDGGSKISIIKSWPGPLMVYKGSQ